MKRKYFLYAVFALCFTFIFSSCQEDDEESQLIQFSYRDYTYQGKNLSVYLNGEELTTVGYVDVKSTMIHTNADPYRDPDKDVVSANPTYNSTIKIHGFPTINATSTFKTISDLMGFKGATSIENVDYEYIGEFTGDPLSGHEFQGLILQLTTK